MRLLTDIGCPVNILIFKIKIKTNNMWAIPATRKKEEVRQTLKRRNDIMTLLSRRTHIEH